MGVRIGSGLSTEPDARFGAAEAAASARDALGGRACDLAVVFASGAHLAAPEATLEGVHEALAPAELVGCGAGGRDRRDARGRGGHGDIRLGRVARRRRGAPLPRRGRADGRRRRRAQRAARARRAPRARCCSPTRSPSRPTRSCASSRPARRCCRCSAGSRARARPTHETPLLIGEEVKTSGAVGVRFDGVEILPCVSQGAAPVGPELTITACEGAIIAELAGRPALEKLRETIEALTVEDLRLVQGGLLMGIVIDPNKPDYVQGDFLVRGLVGADPDTGQVAVGTDVRPGPGRAAARARRRERRPRPALRARRAAARARRADARGRAADRLQRARRGHVRPSPPRRGGARRTSSAARRRRASSPRARSAPSAASTSCTASRRRSPSSREPRRAHRPASPGRPAGSARRPRAPSPRAGRRVIVRAGGRRSSRRSRPRSAAARSSRTSPSRRRAGAAARGGRARRRARRQRRAARQSGELTSYSLEELDRVLDVNLRAPVVLARLLAEAMVARGSGHLVFVSSLSGKSAGAALVAVLGDEVRAARVLAALRQDLEPHGVGVSCVFPGFVRDAGMFAASGASLPPGVGTVTPEAVAAGIVRRSSATGPRSTSPRSGCGWARGGGRGAGLHRVGAAAGWAATRSPARSPTASASGAERRGRDRAASGAPRAGARRDARAGARAHRALGRGDLAAGVRERALGGQIDSAMVAAAINNLRGGRGDARDRDRDRARCVRGIARLRAAGQRPPLWHFLGGLVGAALVGVTTVAAPEVGVALVTVAIVCGSTLGALPVDAAGLGPAGRRPITSPRVVGRGARRRGDGDLRVRVARGVRAGAARARAARGLRDGAAGGGERAARAGERRAVPRLDGQHVGRAARAGGRGRVLDRRVGARGAAHEPAALHRRAAAARSSWSSAPRPCRRWACSGSGWRWSPGRRWARSPST